MPVLDAYTQGLTAQEIAEQCEALAGNPNLHLFAPTQLAPVSPTEFKATPAYRQLRTLVAALYLEYEWPFLGTGGTVQVTARENALPLDFWRLRFPDPLVLLDGDNRYVLWHLDPQTWFHRSLQPTTQSGRPTSFSIDKARSSFYIDPVPNKSYQAELHYYRRPNFDSDAAPDKLTAVADVVRFPHSDLLVQQLLVFYYQHQDDSRWMAAKQEAAEMLLRIRASSDDERDSPAAIPLDSQWFSQLSDWDF